MSTVKNRVPRPGPSEDKHPLPASRADVLQGVAQESFSGKPDMMMVETMVPTLPVTAPPLNIDTSDPSFATDTINSSSPSTSNAGSREVVASSKPAAGKVSRLSDSGKRPASGPIKSAKKPCLGRVASFGSNSASLGAKGKPGQQLQSALAAAEGGPSLKAGSCRHVTLHPAHPATSQNSSPAPPQRTGPGPCDEEGGCGSRSQVDAKDGEVPSESVCTESIGARSSLREPSPHSMPQPAPSGKASVKNKAALIKAMRAQYRTAEVPAPPVSVPKQPATKPSSVPNPSLSVPKPSSPTLAARPAAAPAQRLTTLTLTADSARPGHVSVTLAAAGPAPPAAPASTPKVRAGPHEAAGSSDVSVAGETTPSPPAAGVATLAVAQVLEEQQALLAAQVAESERYRLESLGHAAQLRNLEEENEVLKAKLKQWEVDTKRCVVVFQGREEEQCKRIAAAEAKADARSREIQEALIANQILTEECRTLRRDNSKLVEMLAATTQHIKAQGGGGGANRGANAGAMPPSGNTSSRDALPTSPMVNQNQSGGGMNPAHARSVQALLAALGSSQPQAVRGQMGSGMHLGANGLGLATAGQGSRGQEELILRLQQVINGGVRPPTPAHPAPQPVRPRGTSPAQLADFDMLQSAVNQWTKSEAQRFNKHAKAQGAAGQSGGAHPKADSADEDVARKGEAHPQGAHVPCTGLGDRQVAKSLLLAAEVAADSDDSGAAKHPSRPRTRGRAGGAGAVDLAEGCDAVDALKALRESGERADRSQHAERAERADRERTVVGPARGRASAFRPLPTRLSDGRNSASGSEKRPRSADGEGGAVTSSEEPQTKRSRFMEQLEKRALTVMVNERGQLVSADRRALPRSGSKRQG